MNVATRTKFGRRAGAAATILLAGAWALGASPAHAQGGRGMGQSADTTGAGGAPPLAPLIAGARADSDLRVLVQRFNADLAALGRRYDIPLSPVLHERQRAFFTAWTGVLGEIREGELNAAGRADLAALRTLVRDGLAGVAAAERQFDALAPLVPFARTVQALQERRRDRLPVDGFQAAETLAGALEEVRRLTAAVPGARGRADGPFRGVEADVALAAANFLAGDASARPAGGPGGFGGGAAATLIGTLDSWYSYSAGYDPLFTWWARKPYEELKEALEAYVVAIRAEWRSVS